MNVLKELNNMKAGKYYEGGRVYAYIVDGEYKTCIQFDSETQMRRAGQCLIDLARIGGNEVEIKDKTIAWLEKQGQVKESFISQHENRTCEENGNSLTSEDAIEREVKEDAGGYPYIDATELYDYENDKPLAKAGDRVKVVFIKDK